MLICELQLHCIKMGCGVPVNASLLIVMSTELSCAKLLLHLWWP